MLAEGLQQVVDPVDLLAADHFHGHLEPLANVDVHHLEAGVESLRFPMVGWFSLYSFFSVFL